MLDAAAVEMGGLSRLEELASADDSRLELTARDLDAAARTTMDDKLRALSAVLTRGLTDDTVDEAIILANALTALEAPHVQVLSAVHSRTWLSEVRPTNDAFRWLIVLPGAGR